MNFARIKTLIAAAALLTSASAFANNFVFNRSLPNQAGVGYEFIWGSWDFVTTPAYYTLQEGDVISSNYTFDDNASEGDFVIGGKNTLAGLPLFWAVGTNDQGDKTVTEVAENAGTSSATTDEESDIDYKHRLQIGSVFGGIGVAAYVQLAKAGNSSIDETSATATTKNTTTRKSYDVDASFEDPDVANKFGINIGQNGDGGALVWTLGVGYNMVGGSSSEEFDPATPGSEHTYTGLDALDNTLGTEDDGIGQYSTLELSSFGWIPVDDKGSLIGWVVKADMIVTGSEDVKLETAGVTTDEGTWDASGLDIQPTVFYTLSLPIGDIATMYLNPEVGMHYQSKSLTYKTKGATDPSVDTTESLISFNANLPIMFALPVDKAGKFTINTGWYPQLTVYSKNTTETVSIGDPTKRDTETETSILSATGSYGLGATYKPADNLAMHFLAIPTSDSRANLSTVSFGVDYVFGSTSSAPATEEEAEM